MGLSEWLNLFTVSQLRLASFPVYPGTWGRVSGVLQDSGRGELMVPAPPWPLSHLGTRDLGLELSVACNLQYLHREGAQ